MPRYIDAELLEKKLFPLGMIADGQYAINAKAVKVAIDSIPAADVVEVVRCKDCVLHKEGCLLDTHPYMTADNGYCYLGKRTPKERGGDQ